MSYPRNAASPPAIAVGVIYLLADGTIQTSGASARVKTGGGSWGAAAGTLACDTASGVWTYSPTQGETDAESFLVAVYKASSTAAQVTVVTSASATAGYSGVDWSKITGASSTVDLSGTTVSTSQAIASVSGAVGSVTAGVTVTTNNDKTGYALSNTSRDAIVADFLAHVITKGSAGTIERAFWQAAKSQASADGEVSGTPTASAFDTDLTAVTGAFDDLLIVFVSGSLTGEARPIATYNNTDGRITLQESLTAAPSAADEFLIIPSHTHPISDIQSGLATSAALATVDGNVDTLVARITSTLFSGITSMASWLGALAGKSTDASTLAEIQSTTAGATFANSTDSLEAIRDRGDAAWAPGEAGSGDASQSTLLAVQDQVEAIAGTLGGTAISVTSRIADGGSMVIYTGDDLKVRSGTQVTVSISDPAGGIYSRLSALGTSRLSWGAARQSQAAGAISGTISSLTQSGSGDDQVVNLVIEILDAGQSLNPADDYIWQVASTSSSGDEYTEIEGTLDLRRRVAVPVTV